MSIGIPVILIIGFALLIKGADILVNGASNIAKRFHIPQIVIGLTIVSIGTTLPELFVSVTSAISGHTDMSIGNVIGSTLCNLLLILGLSTTIRPIRFKRETRLIEIPMSIIFIIIFGIVCNTNEVITKLEAIVLIALFLTFIMYTIYMGKKGEQFDKEKDDENEPEEKTVKKSSTLIKDIINIILGAIALKFGANFVVENAIIIAEYFKISEQIIGLTIVAIGTSLPELVTSVVAAIKGNSDISIGNIIGANILNITIIMGVAGLINPIAYNPTYNIEMLLLLVSNIILALFPFIPPRNKMSRRNGIIYLILYIVYTLVLLNT